MAKIRKGHIGDLEAIVEMGEQFWQHTRYYQIDGVEYYPATVRKVVAAILNERAPGYILVVDTDEGVKGMCILAQYFNVWHEGLSTVGELAYWLDEDLRGEGLGKALCQKAEQLARLRGIKYMALVSMDHSMDVGPLYESLGYIKTETTYTKEL